MADKQACKLFDVTVLFITEYNFTSSANNLRFTPDGTILQMTFTNNIKSTGPKTLPSGTPLSKISSFFEVTH